MADIFPLQAQPELAMDLLGFQGNFSFYLEYAFVDQPLTVPNDLSLPYLAPPPSVAARNRGRKIIEKTRELGKIVPSGEKMNTAEMFQVASKKMKKHCIFKSSKHLLHLQVFKRSCTHHRSVWFPKACLQTSSG
ncbi:hypothetical protein RHGRI_017633 [Rhododendron griersonianum]|uniref:Uncharacterized protein n=1 Tax=Rhododendron griersonianum TaxID=479676 RepID=A0AAV6JYI4_9ERIC|nr:hypothetical protein RHGRI_017633 [Rhododendron griersonianum]